MTGQISVAFELSAACFDAWKLYEGKKINKTKCHAELGGGGGDGERNNHATNTRQFLLANSCVSSYQEAKTWEGKISNNNSLHLDNHPRLFHVYNKACSLEVLKPIPRRNTHLTRA